MGLARVRSLSVMGFCSRVLCDYLLRMFLLEPHARPDYWDVAKGTIKASDAKLPPPRYDPGWHHVRAPFVALTDAKMVQLATQLADFALDQAID